MLQRCVIVICILMSLATAATAQSPGRGTFGGFLGGQGRLLIDLAEIRKELKVDEQQTELLDALQEDLAEQRRVIIEEDEGPRYADEAVERLRAEHRLKKLAAFDRRSEALVAIVLEPQQSLRLSELYLQRDGIGAFDRPEVASKLRLTDEQKERLQTLRQTFVDNRLRGRSRERLGELREKEQAAVRELLDEEQQSLWQQLLGKPFDFPSSGFRGPRRR
ncbi:MAG: Spy/CpxP family protein refolding chaperone [Pirellulaceae bacterium]